MARNYRAWALAIACTWALAPCARAFLPSPTALSIAMAKNRITAASGGGSSHSSSFRSRKLIGKPFMSSNIETEPFRDSRAGGLSESGSWHRLRRRDMVAAHPELLELEREDWRGGAMLILANALQFALAVYSRYLPWLGVVALAVTAGGTLSLWQLTLMHDVIHGNVCKDARLRNFLMFFGSLPCVFGYFLYLQFGHLSHHNKMGGHTMAELFASDKGGFEDGDILFVTHRSHISGAKGPYLPPAMDKIFPQRPIVNVAYNVFRAFWRDQSPYRNMLAYTCSMLLERIVLVVSDKITALTGFSGFFPNKPASFHAAASNHARLCAVFQFALVWFLGWKPLIFLYLAECAWSLPIHPSCAMFITNHGSFEAKKGYGLGPAQACQPTRSTYIGGWYDVLCCNTNYHVEHHDMPNVPIYYVPKISQIAPEFYSQDRISSARSIWAAVMETFDSPTFYSCMGVSALGSGSEER